MNQSIAPGLFIVGTDTDVGKTYLTSAVAGHLVDLDKNVGIYKPACSGGVAAEGDAPWKWHDIEAHFEALRGTFPRDRICPQRFIAPLAPPVAAERENRTVSRDLLESGLAWWQTNCRYLLIEGVGGLLCPLTDQTTVAGFAEHAGYPIIIVARSGLGTINHTLLTAAVARNRGLFIAGIVLNQDSPDIPLDVALENAALISQYGRVRVLGIHPWNGNGQLLDSDGPVKMDWMSMARPPRGHFTHRDEFSSD